MNRRNCGLAIDSHGSWFWCRSRRGGLGTLVCDLSGRGWELGEDERVGEERRFTGDQDLQCRSIGIRRC
jgi:hypothetical protein